MKRFSSFCLALLVGLCAFAQKPEINQKWLMNERLLDLLNNYENYVNFNKKSDSYAFMVLFDNSDAPVFCDYLASKNYGKTVSAREYANYSQGLEDRTVLISNLRKTALKEEDGVWKASLEFDKRIDYEDSLGFVFSTMAPMSGGDFHLTMECVWDPASSSFLIQSIKGKENSQSSFPKGDFHIVQKKNEIDSRMLYNGKPLQFNEYGFAILPAGGIFAVDDDDFSLTVHHSPGAGRYEVNSFSVMPKRFRARAHVSFSPIGAYNVTASTDGSIASKSWNVEVGGDIGYAFTLGKSTKLALYTGLGYAISSLSLSASDIRYNLDIADSNRELITRSYNLQEVTEGLSLMDIAIPAFLSLEQNLSPKLTLVMDLGVKAYLSTSAKPKPYHIKGTVNGQSLDKDYEQFVSPNQNSMNQFSVSLMGKAGLDFAVSSGKYIFLHVGYEMGLTDSYAPVTPVQWYSSSGIYPLVYTGSADVAVHSFLGSISYKRSGLVFELGARFKFGKKE